METRIGYKRWTRVWEEMVLVKMLMEIALSRWEERWWWRWWWFPPPGGKFSRQNSSAGALDWFRQGSASWRRSLVLKACLWFFFLDERLHIAEDGHRRATRGPMRQGGAQGGRARPHPRGWWVAPLLYFLRPIFFYIFKNWLPWSFRTFGVVQNRSLIFAPFPAQNPTCRHPPSSCKPCKIRENRHKYCDIMCNNSP